MYAMCASMEAVWEAVREVVLEVMLACGKVRVTVPVPTKYADYTSDAAK
jgi:hypothetical protein